MASRYDTKALAAHKRTKGKLEVRSIVPLRNRDDLSIAYTPGVAAVCHLIAENPAAAMTHTLRGRTIAVVSDGTAILGLGDLGPRAALPVMEGKAILFKKFGGIDAFPIVLDTKDPDEIVSIVTAIAPTFGGINLEDISAPRCFEIEERLKQVLDIPVMHDDQHGTAVVVLAALSNALRVVGKMLRDVRIVVNGAGAAATAIVHLLVQGGAREGNIIILDSKGIVHARRADLRGHKRDLAARTNAKQVEGGLAEALAGADVFIGTSVRGALRSEWVDRMADQPVVFALANPDPEIAPKDAAKTKIAIFGTGRSDLPNQINNVLAFPGIFRGALDAGAREITDEMKLAASKAIASLVTGKDLKSGIVIPKALDPKVAPVVAKAVAREWKSSQQRRKSDITVSEEVRTETDR